MLGQIILAAEMAMNSTNASQPRFVVYSAHSRQLEALLAILGAWDDDVGLREWPPCELVKRCSSTL